jgi:hypothetical protein
VSLPFTGRVALAGSRPAGDAATVGVLVENSVPSEPDANRVMLLADDSAAQIDLWSAHWTVPIQRTA